MFQQTWFQNQRSIKKIVLTKPEKSRILFFNLKDRNRLLIFCVKQIYGQSKTYLKVENILFKLSPI